MGVLVDSVKAVLGRGQSVTATAPVGVEGVPQIPVWSYERAAREGYGANELVYACVEALATSAAEPRLCAYRGDEKLDAHPLVDLWERPNPYTDRFTLTATLVMHLQISGNAYLEKVRSGAGKVVELWTPRPDRVFVIPDSRTFVRGYEYRIGPANYLLPPDDVAHLRLRHPLDDHYGLAPLAVLAGRVDLDNWAREFVRAFFTNAGVPAGLLTVKRALDQQEADRIKRRFREGFSGPAGWHNLLVLANTEADYKPMGLPLGESGAGLEQLDAQTEARVCMAFGVPPAILSTRLGMNASSYANQVAQMRMFWTQTLIPLYRMMAAALTRSLVPEYPDVDRLEFDLDDVAALAQDQDQLHTRVREDLKAGMITRTEARVAAGYPPEPEEDGTYLVPATLIPTPSGAEAEAMAALPEPTAAEAASAAVGGDYALGGSSAGANGRTSGRR